MGIFYVEKNQVIWKNIYTNEGEEGGKEIEALAELDMIPVFEKI